MKTPTAAPARMRAAVYTRYGPPEVVRVEEVDKPSPRANEVLVRVHATTVCAADWRLRKADPILARFFNGLWRPKKRRVLGMEFSGTIESVGASVTRFQPGDEVFGSPFFKFGAHAEYVCIAEDGLLAPKPANMTLEDAAAVFFGGGTVLSFFNAAAVKPGQKVLIYGASGSVGVFAVQLAKHVGAHVTAVCSTSNLEMVRSLGADAVVDYTREDFSQAGRIYDVVFDAVGKAGYRRSMSALKRGGTYVLVAGIGRKWFVSNFVGGLLATWWAAATGRARIVGMPKSGGVSDLLRLKLLIEAGQLRTVIDRRYTLDDIVDAHRHAEGGHKKGHVLIRVERPATPA